MRKAGIALLPFIFFIGIFPEHSSARRIAVSHDTLTTTDSIMIFWLNKEAVFSNKPVAKKFYCWLSQQELDSVRSQNMLLRNYAPGSVMNIDLEQKLNSEKFKKDQMAFMLRESRFGRRRDAWVNIWGELDRGQMSGSDQLVEIDLEDSSLIVVFTPREKHPWKVFDMNGNIFQANEALDHSSRIAGIFFEDETDFSLAGNKDDHKNKLNKKSKDKKSFRTFFIVNETMIRSWHHAVPGLQDKILQELTYMLLGDAWLKNEETDKHFITGSGEDAWEKQQSEMNITQLYWNCIRIDEDASRPCSANVEGEIHFLRDSWIKQKDPVEKFPSRGVR
ncbi:MAG: hypothetical protein HY064_08850 [Bacteroidetes bacterium]|nr:hypothetical protein [Bacteroidota bacterium]